MPSSYSIGDHFEKMAKDLVASGRYASVSEVLREGLRLIEVQEQQRQAKLEWLRGEVAEGYVGEAEEFDLEAIKRDGRRNLQNKRESDAA